MQTIDVYIDEETIRVNTDKPTAYKFAEFYLERLKGKGRFTADELARFGFNLFENIFSTKGRCELINRMLKIKKEDRLVITINSEFDKIHNIPFEIINHNGTKEGFLLKKGNISIVRNIPFLNKEITPAEGPVRILIILSLPIQMYHWAPLDPLRELEVVYEALEGYTSAGLVEIDVEEKADKNTIRQRLLDNRYDIVHFIGHGKRSGYLTMEDEEDYFLEKQIGPDELKDIFEGTDVRLFYFDACETAKAEEFEPSLASHIYQSVPSGCVLANILPVKDRIATEITGYIYKSLFEEEIGNVLNASRLMIPEDWWKPVIFCRPKIRLFNLGKPLERRRKRLILRSPQTTSNYVYRFSIIREASNFIEKKRFLVLHGIGGVGKSTLANYLSRFYDTKFTHIIFFDLKEEGIKTPQILLTKILDELVRNDLLDNKELKRLEDQSLSSKILNGKRLDLIRKTLNERTLLILDNLEETIQDEDGVIVPEWKETISEILNSQNIFTIFTSRVRPKLTKREPLGRLLEIGEYKDVEVDFLIQILDEKERAYFQRHYDRIYNYFRYHPLSLSLAITNKFENLERLIELKEFKDYFEFYRSYFNRYPTDTKRLFSLEYPFSKIFIESVLSPDFLTLIQRSLLILNEDERGLLLPYKVISTYFTKDFALGSKELKDFTENLLKVYEERKLLDFDLLNIFLILLRYYESGVSELAERQNIETKLLEVFGLLDGRNLLSHIPLTVIERFIELVEKFSLSEDIKAGTLNNLGNFYRNTNRLDEVERYYLEALEIYRRLAEKNSAFLSDVAGTLNNLGVLYKNTNRLDEAEKHYLEALEIRRRLAKKNSAFLSDVAMTLNNLGNLYRNTNRLDEAERYYLEALEIYRKFADENPAFLSDVAMTLNNLGALYWNTNRLDEAERYYSEALEIYRRFAEKNSAFLSNVAGTLDNLGVLYKNTNRLNEAERCHLKALGIRRRLAEKNSAFLSDVAATLNNLGILYWNTNRLDEAERYYLEALEIYRKFADENPAFLSNVAMTLNNLGVLYWNTNRLNEAERYYLEALGIRRRLAEENQDFLSDVATTLNNLGILYWNTNRLDEAERYYLEALEIYRKFADENPAFLYNVGGTLNNLGLLYSDTNRLDEAERYYSEALKIYRRLAEKNSAFLSNVATTLNNLGILYSNTNRLNEAERHYLEALEIYKQIKDFTQQFRLYPAFIDTLIKSKVRDYKLISQHLCDYLELYYDVFLEDKNSFSGIVFFIKQKTFSSGLEIEGLKEAVETPLYRERLERFLELIRVLSPGVL